MESGLHPGGNAHRGASLQWQGRGGQRVEAVLVWASKLWPGGGGGGGGAGIVETRKWLVGH